jgi:hypothetical protein
MSGTLTIVECKLKTNPEIRREVVGQLLAYAAGLWQRSYDDFEATWRHRSQRGLRDHLTEKVGIGLDADDLRRTVSERLACGVFSLVIAVDEITAELKRVVESLNATTRDEVSALAVELQYVKDGTTEILILRGTGKHCSRPSAAPRAAARNGRPRRLQPPSRAFQTHSGRRSNVS